MAWEVFRDYHKICGSGIISSIKYRQFKLQQQSSA